MKENLKKYLTEMIGTYFLVFTIACTGLLGSDGVIAPLAIGAVLMVMVYAGGHISGGHYNPAVSLAASIRGALPFKQFIPYVIAQVIGGALAATTFIAVAGDFAEVEVASYDLKALLIAEFIFTFALCYVVLQTATTKSTQGNSYYGIAIGSIVMVGAFSVGGALCAGAFNPAVAVSVGILSLTTWSLLVWTIVANLVAAICAAIAFKMTYTEVEE